MRIVVRGVVRLIFPLVYLCCGLASLVALVALAWALFGGLAWRVALLWVGAAVALHALRFLLLGMFAWARREEGT